MEILETTIYGDIDRGEIGINRLIEEEGALAAFPLHDGDSTSKKDDKNLEAIDGAPEKSITSKKTNERAILKSIWSNYINWYKYQPLELVRNYFGEKVKL